MATVSQGQSQLVNLGPNDAIKVSAPGEAYVDHLSGTPESPYASVRLIKITEPKIFGPYGVNAQLMVRVVEGFAVLDPFSAPQPAMVDSSKSGTVVGGFLAGPRGSMNIRNAHKIKRMLAAIARSGTERVNILAVGPSWYFGTGSNDQAVYSGEAAGRSQCMIPIAGRRVNSAFGGIWTPGVDVAANNTATFTVTSPASFANAYNGLGPQGLALACSNGAGAVHFSVIDGRAGQKVKIYGMLNSATAQTPRYSTSGANAQAETTSPASVPAGNLLPNGAQHWYEWELTLANAGTTAITLKSPASGANYFIWGVDLDYRTDPGVTFHRWARGGTSIGTVAGWAIDDTDIQPAGTWIGADTATRNRRAATLQSSLRIPTNGVIGGADVNDIFYSQISQFGWTLADHKRHVRNFVKGYNDAGIPVLLQAGMLRNPASIVNAAGGITQQDIINIYREVSDESPDVCGAAFFDLTQNYSATDIQAKYAEQWQDTTFALANELPTPLHPGRNGHALFGNMIGAALVQAANAV